MGKGGAGSFSLRDTPLSLGGRARLNKKGPFVGKRPLSDNRGALGKRRAAILGALEPESQDSGGRGRLVCLGVNVPRSVSFLNDGVNRSP